MKRRIFGLFIAVLCLTSVVPLTAQSRVTKMSGASLKEVSAKLYGAGGQPGLMGGAAPFEADFTNMVLTVEDTAALLDLVRNPSGLPPRSELTISGRIASAPFKAKAERNRSGHLEFKLEGVKFADHQQIVNLLGVLVGHGVREAKLQSFVGERPVEVKFEEKAPRIEPPRVEGQADR